MGERLPVVIRPSLEAAFRAAWPRCRVFLFSAPCGFGKTTTAAALLREFNVCALNGQDASFAPEEIPPDCAAVLVDDLQYLLEPERQQALCACIRSRTELHFVLLGRGRVPGWLMPFQFAGVMQTLGADELLFDRETSRHMLEGRGVCLSPTDMGPVQRDFNGYPLAMELLSRRLQQSGTYSREIYDACRRDLFVYYDEAVFHRFDPSLRALLLNLAYFEHFHLELAKMVSGDSRAGELLGVLQRDTTMLLFDGPDTYHFWPIFRAFLLWECSQLFTDADRALAFSRAALYYELRGELAQALACYSKAGEQSKVSAILIKNAVCHPGLGYYREMQDYYFALPREEILRSPALICGMSMLTAMCLDYESSEQWYRELENYAARLKKSDSEYSEARGRLAYLDIALPQRGSKGLIRVIESVFRVMTDKKLQVPAFSVTSMLPSIMNGGKDFCDWSKRDDLLYATMRAPVETVLGRDGVGLADCAICESKFEKGENVSERLLALMARLGEIQSRGTPDIEFAVIGLLARVQVAQGRAPQALETVQNLRSRFESAGEVRFLGNIDALICRIRLRLGDGEAVRAWLKWQAPGNETRLWAMWRYQYLTRVMAQLSEGETAEPLLLLARLTPYCEACGRVMDGLHIRLLTALCRYRRGDALWRETLHAALDICAEYRFILPVAQYGAAILPMLRECGWQGNAAFFKAAVEAARAQAVLYPKFLIPEPPLVEPLSAAELQVLRLLCQNLSNQEIGDILDIKLATVKSHVSHILQKLNVGSRSAARDAAERLRLV